MIEIPSNYVTRAEQDRDIENWWFRFGHRLGWDEGYAAGFAHAEAVNDQVWRQIATTVKEYAKHPTFQELKEYRARPGGAIWIAEQKRTGGKEYTGGPVPEW